MAETDTHDGIPATWRSLGAHCRELGWSKRRVMSELQQGMPYRTIPPGHVIDWHHPVSAQTLALETSEVTIFAVEGYEVFNSVTVGVEVLPPAVLAVNPYWLGSPSFGSPPLSVTASAAHPTPRAGNVSGADLRACILAIKTEHPRNNPPLEEEALIAEVERRFETTIPRDRIRQARDDVAPEFKRPPGRPRKNAQ
jgi:hypothetical protein